MPSGRNDSCASIPQRPDRTLDLVIARPPTPRTDDPAYMDLQMECLFNEELTSSRFFRMHRPEAPVASLRGWRAYALPRETIPAMPYAIHHRTPVPEWLDRCPRARTAIRGWCSRGGSGSV